MDCIFCKIINNELPSSKVYEDENVLAFLDVNPVSKGHCLVIPKKHCKDIFDIPEKDLRQVIFVARKIAVAVEKGLNAKGVNVMHASRKEAQQSVFHFHIHVIPRYANDGLNTWPKSNYNENNFQEVENKIKGFLR